MFYQRKNINAIVFVRVLLFFVFGSNLVGGAMFANPVQLFELFKTDLEVSRIIEESRLIYEQGPIKE
jgi:hypothetical protein